MVDLISGGHGGHGMGCPRVPVRPTPARPDTARSRACLRAAAHSARRSVAAGFERDGTPDEVAWQIDCCRRAAGGDLRFIARLYFAGLPWDVQRRTLRLFAERTVPKVGALAAEHVSD